MSVLLLASLTAYFATPAQTDPNELQFTPT
jgi:hypothetical protein